jgi:hypothetical protein
LRGRIRATIESAHVVAGIGGRGRVGLAHGGVGLIDRRVGCASGRVGLIDGRVYAGRGLRANAGAALQAIRTVARPHAPIAVARAEDPGDEEGGEASCPRS